MKLSGWKNEYLITTSEVSKLTRQWAFGGIAVIWVFRVGGQGVITLPNGLIYPLLLFCASLGMDFLHNLVRGEIWKWFYRIKEKKLKNISEDPDVTANKSLRIIVDLLYYPKILLLFIAYIWLCVCLISALN